MADSNRASLVDEFCKVTGSDPVRARQYLEAAGWDSNLATSSYFEEADEEDEEDIPVEQTQERFSSRSEKTNPSAQNRIATLASLVNNDDTDEEGQAFYAGGSERSGQQVLGPSKKKNAFVEDMFRAAKSHGAEAVQPSELKRSEATKLRVFHGTGHILDSTTNDSESVGNPEAANSQPGAVEVCLRVWRTGFTVDDGPFREYNDPNNVDFIDSIKKGQMPLELKRQAEDDIQLDIEDHSLEDYVPKRSTKAFAGAGFRLGSITPPVLDLSSPQRGISGAGSSLTVDNAQPVTSIQVRLADGTRLTITANHSHTVGDIRRHIVNTRPEYGAAVFSLMTAYPSKELQKDEASLSDENLLNAVIVQKIV